jgi:hypothetical protein
MKISRKSMVLGFVGFGIAAALAGGVGVAQAAGTTPTSSPTETTWGFGLGHGAGTHATIGVQNSCRTAAATYLGLSQTDLQAQLQAGKSLAGIAKDKGKSVSGLQDAMIAAVKSALDANITLTAEQKATCLERMKSRIATMINQAHTSGAGRGHRGGWMRVR